MRTNRFSPADRPFSFPSRQRGRVGDCARRRSVVASVAKDFISGAIDSPHARRTNGERSIVDANAKANDDQVMTDGGGATTNSFFLGRVQPSLNYPNGARGRLTHL